MLLLEFVYRKVELEGQSAVETRTFLEAHPMDTHDLIRVVEYLHGEGLIRKVGDRGDGHMLLTLQHQGVVEIEAAHLHPKNGTPHFTATVIHNHFHAQVHAVQQGNQNEQHIQEDKNFP